MNAAPVIAVVDDDASVRQALGSLLRSLDMHVALYESGSQVLSAVDTHTEEKILRALRSIRQGRTVLIVSHRVSSVKDADHIVVLDDGHIVERGSHEALVAKGGYYADLYRRQTIEDELEDIA